MLNGSDADWLTQAPDCYRSDVVRPCPLVWNRSVEKPTITEVAHLGAAEGKRTFLAQCEGEVTEKTHLIYHVRLEPFVRWCDEEDIITHDQLSTRNLHQYLTWGKGGWRPSTESRLRSRPRCRSLRQTFSEAVSVPSGPESDRNPGLSGRASPVKRSAPPSPVSGTISSFISLHIIHSALHV